MYEIVILDTVNNRRFSVFFDTPQEKRAWLVKHKISPGKNKKSYTKKLLLVAQWKH